MKRIGSIDITRGIVMVIMALDHVRDLIHVDSLSESPTNLQTTSPILFFTRWITYICAPTFVFLAGTSAYLSFKKNGLEESRNFLLKRGLYLILLEFIVVNFALYFDPGYHTLLFEVIATIGFGFIVLALLLRVPVGIILTLGLIIIFGHNLLSLLPPREPSVGNTLFTMLFGPGAVPFSGRVFIMAYPPIPWLGIMLTGFAAGKIFALPSGERRRFFTRVGIGALLLFIAARAINVYGDPQPWATQKSAVYSFLSFMNVTKYPPSLLFCLVTLGIMFLLLATTEEAKNRVWRIVSVYGKVPLFYFILHFFLIHVIMLAIMLLQGFQPAQLDFASGSFGRPKGVDSGLHLGWIYLLWIGVVVLLYFPCRWFGRYKSTHNQWWLKYL